MGKISLIEGTTIAHPDRRFWSATPPANPTPVNYLYSLGLFDLVTYKALKLPGADPAEAYRGSPWFQFPTPPQAYELSEPAATTIVPTQGGGKFVESQGSIIKDIRLSGTVGLRPNPPSSNLLPAGLSNVTGVSLSIPKSLGSFLNDERGLSPKEITGFDDITFLRNIFRGYWDLKKSNEWARRTVMVWFYAKDSDVFIVEPMNFSATKEKGNPLSYTYNITLRTLYRFDHTIKKEDDPINGFQKLVNVFSIAAQASRDIVTAVNQISNAIDYVSSLPSRIADTLVGEAIAIIGALANLRNTGTRLNEMGSALVEKWGNNAKELHRQCTILEGGKSPAGVSWPASDSPRVYNSTGRFVWSKASPPPGAFIFVDGNAALALLKNPAVRAATLMLRSADRIRAVDAFFTTTKQIVVNNQKEPYNRSGPQFTVGSPLNVNNITIPSSASEDLVGGNETLRDIAKRTMGDEAYWKMLAILNNLKPPYISTASGDGVLAGGDKILIPKRADPGDISSVPVDNNTDAASEELSPILKKYGRDIRLSNGSSGTDYADFEVSQSGDLDTVEGIANVEQAIMIKVATEQGELSLHPTFGAAYPVGTKLSLSQMQEFALNTRRTLLDDPRIKDISKLQTYAEGDVIRVHVVVTLRQTDVQLPIEFTVRRT